MVQLLLALGKFLASVYTDGFLLLLLWRRLLLLLQPKCLCGLRAQDELATLLSQTFLPLTMFLVKCSSSSLPSSLWGATISGVARREATTFGVFQSQFSCTLLAGLLSGCRPLSVQLNSVLGVIVGPTQLLRLYALQLRPYLRVQVTGLNPYLKDLEWPVAALTLAEAGVYRVPQTPETILFSTYISNTMLGN